METQRVAVIIEDDKDIRDLLHAVLQQSGFEVHASPTGSEGVEAVRMHNPAVVTLDLGLPDIDGFEVIRQLRLFSDAYIVMLTARAEELDTLMGLEAGADDYITKPFAVEELLARIRALTRRVPQDDASPVVSLGDVTIDLAAHSVVRTTPDGDRQIRLTPTEWQFIEILIRNAGKLVTRQTVLRTIWGTDHAEDTGYLRLYVSQLRKKLEPDPSAPRYLLTEPGMGYRLDGVG